MILKIIKSSILLLFATMLYAQNSDTPGTNTPKNETLFKSIEFKSDGATLRGRLYTPERRSKTFPIVIMAHGFSATINGMVADRYAEVFCTAGFAVLLYDHRNLGISDGEPRQQLNRWTQARGYRDAIDFVMTIPQIDSAKIGLWGDSMSGDEVIVVAAIDQRVKAVVAQVPACGRELPLPDPEGKLFQAIKETFLSGNIDGTPETILGPMPVVSFDQQSIPSLLKPLSAFRWFMEYGGRYDTKWINNATYVTPNVPSKFNSVLCIPYIKAPLLMVIARDDEMGGANPEVAKHAYEIAPEPKKMIEIDGGHFGLLHYPSPLFDEISESQVDFLIEYLQ